MDLHDDFSAFFDECLVRAVELRLRHLSPADLASAIDQAEGSGYVLVRPIYAGPLPEVLAAHLRTYISLQKQMVQAALSGDRRDALQAFLLEPTIAARLDLAQTEALLEEMLAAHAEYLPQFA